MSLARAHTSGAIERAHVAAGLQQQCADTATLKIRCSRHPTELYRRLVVVWPGDPGGDRHERIGVADSEMKGARPIVLHERDRRAGRVLAQHGSPQRIGLLRGQIDDHEVSHDATSIEAPSCFADVYIASTMRWACTAVGEVGRGRSAGQRRRGRTHRRGSATRRASAATAADELVRSSDSPCRRRCRSSAPGRYQSSPSMTM